MAYRMLGTAGAAVLTMASLVGAQPPDVRRTTTTTATTTTTEIRKASGIMNANVVVQGGATVGRVSDFVISDGGCIEYVVVAYDDRSVLLPYQAIRVDMGQHIVQVNVTREKWRDIPTFTGTSWPVHDERYISRVRGLFGITESGYRGDRREGDRRPLAPGEQRREGDHRPVAPGEERRDERRDQPPQRRDVENPNRPAPPPPPAQPEPNRDRDRQRTPPPPPPSTPGSNPPPV